MLLEAKEDLPDEIYIGFRTDGSLLNLRRLLVRTKTTEELITELLFADDCALFAHTEEAQQHIVNRFSDAAENFGLIFSLKKTEMLYQPPPRVAYSPLHISIDGTNLNAVTDLCVKVLALGSNVEGVDLGPLLDVDISVHCETR